MARRDMGAFGKLGMWATMLFVTSACYEVLDVRDYRVIETATCEPPKHKGTPLYDATALLAALGGAIATA